LTRSIQIYQFWKFWFFNFRITHSLSSIPDMPGFKIKQSLTTYQYHISHAYTVFRWCQVFASSPQATTVQYNLISRTDRIIFNNATTFTNNHRENNSINSKVCKFGTHSSSQWFSLHLAPCFDYFPWFLVIHSVLFNTNFETKRFSFLYVDYVSDKMQRTKSNMKKVI